MSDQDTTARSWQEHDPRHLLEQEAPRYTSYPSAHHFGPMSPEVHSRWLEQLSSGGSVGLYIHIPFCEQMCWFCGCNTQITRRHEPVTAYVESLIAEIAEVSRRIGFRPMVHALHFGGGSPGMLRAAELDLIFGMLHDRFYLLPHAEISVELDPRKVTEDSARVWASHGVNRISLGLQDTSPKVQKAINRLQPMPLVRGAVSHLRNAGITSLGLDLIYGLPHQDEASYATTLKDAISLSPDRLSGFSYAHVPWVRKHQRLIDTASLPDSATKLGLFDQMTETLADAGYVPIGIDHFARPDDGLARALSAHQLRRNFMGYTDQPNDRLIAFGASAISEFDEGLVQNVSQSTTYQRLIDDEGLATNRGYAYRGEDRLRRDVIMALMCYFEADIGAILRRHAAPADTFVTAFDRLRRFEAMGVVAVEGQRVRLTSPLKMLIRPVAAVFDVYMAAPGSEANPTPRYSRVA